jgi:D-glycerate 3-kinase
MDYLSIFPEELSGISNAECIRITDLISRHLQANLKQLKITEDLTDQISDIFVPLASSLCVKAKQQQDKLIVGINGAQGSGKSTLCVLLETILNEGFGLRATSLSIDDLYCTRAERRVSGERIHPLLATRGVPGTHDVSLGMEILKRLSNKESGHNIAIPVFDKAADDRAPEEEWRKATPPFDLILFEGWCVGARPQDESLLASPVNTLEANEDCDGTWRSYVNKRLKSDYAELFDQLDLLIMLQVPDLECVFKWRSLQERKLALQQGETLATHILSQAELERFIMHYERLTSHMLSEMPEYSDIVLRLNSDHRIDGIRINSGYLKEQVSV